MYTSICQLASFAAIVTIDTSLGVGRAEAAVVGADGCDVCSPNPAGILVLSNHVPGNHGIALSRKSEMSAS